MPLLCYFYSSSELISPSECPQVSQLHPKPWQVHPPEHCTHSCNTQLSNQAMLCPLGLCHCSTFTNSPSTCSSAALSKLHLLPSMFIPVQNLVLNLCCRFTCGLFPVGEEEPTGDSGICCCVGLDPVHRGRLERRD